MMKTEVRQINGNPELYINDRLVGRTIARLAEPGYQAPVKIDQYREAGLNIFITSLHEANDWCWDGAGGYDYETYEAHFAAILDALPDALLIPFVGGRTGTPYLWCRNHQDQLLTREDGTRPRVASFASRLWQKDSAEAIRRFVEHFENSEFADHIIGYNPIFINNEWLAWVDHGSYADFSAPMLNGFREWLRTRYGNDESALRKSWKDENVTFETAAIPVGEERLSFGHEGLFHYVEEYGNKVGDYYRCYNDLVADLALSFCRQVKEQTQNEKLCGMMFLYMYCFASWTPSNAYTGHMAYRKILESSYVDYLHSPYDYLHRCFGGTHFSQQTSDTIMIHGKIHFDQIDTKTYVHRPPNTNSRTPWETWQVLKRDAANSLTRNSYHYYYEMGPGCFGGFESPNLWRDLTYHGKDISAWIAELTEWARANQDEQPGYAADTALMNSTDYGYVRRHHRGYAVLFMGGFRNHVVAFSGAPFADYTFEDFDIMPRKHKVYFIPNAFYVTSEMRDAIHRKLKADGATAVWFYAPGYVSENGPSLENIKKLTGFRLARRDALKVFLQIDVTDFTHPLTRGLEGHTSPGGMLDPGSGCTFGSDLDPDWFRARQEWGEFEYDRDAYQFTPLFTVDDAEATVLGTLRTADEPGFAVKEMDGWTSIYLAAPYPPWKLVNQIIDVAGGHVYSRTPDLVYANAKYIAFCANGGGEKTLRLPEPCNVRELFDGDIAADNASEVTFHARHGEVKVFSVQ